MIVIAYDDREITLDGKKVISPTGGTYRASQRMMDRLFKEGWSSGWRRDPFERYTGPNGQIEFFIHPNPKNKILHTALVGEMNGLLLGLTVGTDHIVIWNAFPGERAYTDSIRASRRMNRLSASRNRLS